MENKFSVYIHIFPNKKVYVGITSKEPEKRQHTVMFGNIINKVRW